MSMLKYTPKFIDVTDHPIIIVGERPGKTRDGSTLALQGNRTGDFVHEAIGDTKNLILTNLYNTFHEGKFRLEYVAEGVIDLIELIELHEPSMIITLGGPAYRYVISIKSVKCPVYSLPHPSWINRFKTSYRHEYINQLKDAINRRVSTNTGLGRAARYIL